MFSLADPPAVQLEQVTMQITFEHISTVPSAGELLADLPAVPHPAGGAAGRLRPESPRRLRSAGGWKQISTHTYI